VVEVVGRRSDKAGARIDPEARVEVRGSVHPYVSRGGVKLAAALDAFGVDPTGKVAADVGASTGGFTDCLLRRGAARVHAIDVGKGQLDWSLRKDPRVVLHEETNVRHLDRASIPDRIELVVGDLSFISLTLVLSRLRELLEPG